MLKISPTKPEIKSIQKPEIVFVKIGKYFLIFKKNLEMLERFRKSKIVGGLQDLYKD